ncbi:MAG: hypothetical protein ACJ8EL_17105 [Rhizomicrobium sp.]
MLGTPAQAGVSISGHPTKNMDCVAGVCTPTAPNSVLNVGDLAGMLAVGDVKVIADTAAKDIRFAASLSWTSSNRLTLESYRSIVFQRPVSVVGKGALTLITHEGDSSGDFWFERNGQVEFWDLNSSLTINGQPYTLVKSIRQLAMAVTADPSASYALSKNYDASKDGAYARSPVPALSGGFEGLGNVFSNITINSTDSDAQIGLFEAVGGLVHNAAVANIAITAQGTNNYIGGLAGAGDNVVHSSASGSISGSGYLGGLLGLGGSSISYSQASVNLTSSGGSVGGLVGDLYGTGIFDCFATGAVTGGDGAVAGGLVGLQEEGFIVNSYATGRVQAGANAVVGGLVGVKVSYAFESYSTGSVSGGTGTPVGGFAGTDYQACCNSYDYWDKETSGTGKGTGYGNERYVVGLKTGRFKSAIPEGFDPAFWKESPGINDGYPYLISNAPK